MRNSVKLAIILLGFGQLPSIGHALNGFDLSETTVPAADLLPGGPPKDGIPALTDPDFIAAEEVSFLEPNDRVLGVIANGVTKAYPLSIMTRHEIVNDTFDGRPVVVTYCPLCFAGMVFDARIEGRRQTFGVSGLLYNSDVVLYDRETESLWSQLLQQAISGPRRGQALTLLHSTNTTWSDWRERHPGTLVLSDHTGFAVDYETDRVVARLDDGRRPAFPGAISGDGVSPQGVCTRNRAGRHCQGLPGIGTIQDGKTGH